MLTESEIENINADLPAVDVTTWQAEVLRLIHRRRVTPMLDDGDLDMFNVLLIAQVLEQRSGEFELTAQPTPFPGPWRDVGDRGVDMGASTRQSAQNGLKPSVL